MHAHACEFGYSWHKKYSPDLHDEAHLPFVLAFPPIAVALLRRACSWSNSKSSRRWVKASFCWMAIRNKEFSVFFSSSAAASCLCMSSSWVTYSSHLVEAGRWRKEHRKRGEPEMNISASRWSKLPWTCHIASIPQPAFSRWEDESPAIWLRITSDCSHNALCLSHKRS